jgi:CBS domain-containing protein
MTDVPAGGRGFADETRVVEWKPALEGATAGNIMNPGVLSVAPETTLREIVELLVEHHISAVPVVDAERAVIGMISETDLIDEEKRRVRLPRTLLYGVFPILEEAVRELYNEGLSLAARDLMTRRVFTVPEDASARQVADEMVARKINHVPVTRNAQLVGIIARADLLRAIQGSWKKPGAQG